MQNKQFERLLKLVLLLLLILISVTGCQTSPIPTLETDILSISCSSFFAISYSRTDTLETRRQIIAHNAAYSSICGAK